MERTGVQETISSQEAVVCYIRLDMSSLISQSINVDVGLIGQHFASCMRD